MRHTQNKASLKRKLEGAKLKPNPPLDALRKDFAQPAKPQPKAAKISVFHLSVPVVDRKVT